MDDYVILAKKSIEAYVNNREVIEVSEAPEEIRGRHAGAFVSIHKKGMLRGCIGTIAPAYDNLAQEIIMNGIAASTKDPRFNPIAPDELKDLDINVDVLSEAEEISSRDELDVKRYGVIVENGYRRGVLLPDLEGVDTVDMQVAIAKQKAGIRQGEPVKLYRFEVVRHV